ncbi:hypothetical protein MATL_G00045780 [Megalops atlanticus]|uniref:Uncharacterized protein n=1 Tax=Megalops atlanticus TaxID=7932 RepID=A0A9D3TEM3_MEGAT|nr:hypothetical protein MATL_G00045780 [Megalops atlanticus]
MAGSGIAAGTLHLLATGITTPAPILQVVGSPPLPACGDSVDRHRRAMGVKVLQCFPWPRSTKDRGNRHRSLTAGPSKDVAVHHSCVADRCIMAEGWASARPAQQVYFSQKACITLRHQMDCNVIDATY